MRLVSLSLPILLAAGCGLVRMQNGGTSTSGGIHYIYDQYGHANRVGPYWGPECVKLGVPTEPIRGRNKDADPTVGKQPNLSHDPADQVLRLVCADMILAAETEPERNTWVTQHFRFDEIYFDHFTASMMLVQCLLADSCLDGPHVVKPVHDLNNAYAEQMRAERANEGPRVWQFYQAGMMRWYADHLDVAEVEKRLAALPLPGAAQQTYLRLVGLAQQGVIAFTDSLTPEAKAMFVDIPVKTFEARTAQYARSAKIVGELATLVDRSKAERAAGTQGVSDETLARLAKLRVTYEASCGAQDCTHDMLFAALTKQLFWAYVSRGDAPAAMAETKLLDKLDPSAQLEIADKQTKAIEAARGRLARVESARKQGVDAESARATANGSVLDLGDGRYVYRWHRDFKIYWESLIPNHQSVGHIDGKVAGLDRRGNAVTVRFQDIVSAWQEGTNCYETGRIDSIDRNGKINYREECRGSTTKTERHKVAPVTMPASEAIGLRPGDEIFGFSTTGPNRERVGGRVWVVRRNNRLVRLRDVPL